MFIWLGNIEIDELLQYFVGALLITFSLHEITQTPLKLFLLILVISSPA